MTSQRAIPPGRELLKKGNATAQRVLKQSRIMADVVGRHAKALPEAMNPQASLESLAKAGKGLMGTPQNLAMDAASYMLDAAQRSFLFWDTMREAGNNFVSHEQAGCPPVLIFDYETVVDGRKLKRRCSMFFPCVMRRNTQGCSDHEHFAEWPVSCGYWWTGWFRQNRAGGSAL